MKYQMRVVIEDPNVELRMVAEVRFNLTCHFMYQPECYGNGYIVSIEGDNFYKQIYGLRYDESFNCDKRVDWLKTWARSYWSGKNGTWAVKHLEIIPMD